MLIETLLASLHVLAVLGMVVFSTSQAVMCRPEWVDAAIVQRLQRMDRVYLMSVALLLLSGGARIIWGIKGWQWYVSQPLFHLKMLLVVLTLVWIGRCSLTLHRWGRDLQTAGSLPDAAAIARLRRAIMLHTHWMPFIAVIAVFWARGWWSRGL